VRTVGTTPESGSGGRARGDEEGGGDRRRGGRRSIPMATGKMVGAKD
jgi:hypothetical protein